MERDKERQITDRDGDGGRKESEVGRWERRTQEAGGQASSSQGPAASVVSCESVFLALH